MEEDKTRLEEDKTKRCLKRWDIILSYCKDEGYKIYQTIPERVVLLIFAGSIVGNKKVEIRYEEKKTFLCINIRPFNKIKKERRPEAFQRVNQENVRLTYGSIRIDPKDGEVTITSGVDYGEVLTDKDFRQLLDNTFSLSLMLSNKVLSSLKDLFDEEEEEGEGKKKKKGEGEPDMEEIKEACRQM